MKHCYWLLILVPLLFGSCDNELDILEDYQEIPVIYGLINTLDSNHYVRVQKGYLGPGNALEFAQNADSLYYDTASVRITLEKIVNGNPQPVGTFRPDFTIVKEEGVFTNNDHYVFKLANTGLDYTKQYRLKFVNLNTGKVVTATTPLIPDIYQRNLTPNTKVNLADPAPFIVRFSSSEYGKIYGLILRIRYVEESLDSLQIRTTKTLDYKLPPIYTLTTLGGEEMAFQINGSSIFSFMGNSIPENPNVMRLAGDVRADFLFTAGTEELYNYLEINSPDNTVNYIPEFTNVIGGKGIFTCRLDESIKGLVFNPATYDSIANGRFTGELFE